MDNQSNTKTPWTDYVLAPLMAIVAPKFAQRFAERHKNKELIKSIDPGLSDEQAESMALNPNVVDSLPALLQQKQKEMELEQAKTAISDLVEDPRWKKAVKTSKDPNAILRAYLIKQSTLTREELNKEKQFAEKLRRKEQELEKAPTAVETTDPISQGISIAVDRIKRGEDVNTALEMAVSQIAGTASTERQLRLKGIIKNALPSFSSNPEKRTEQLSEFLAKKPWITKTAILQFAPKQLVTQYPNLKDIAKEFSKVPTSKLIDYAQKAATYNIPRDKLRDFINELMANGH